MGQTCAYVSGLQTYVHEKQRVESLLESELCRCHENEHAIAANYEVTVQGDLDMYSIECQKKRKAIKKSPKFIQLVQQLWELEEFEQRREKDGSIGKGIFLTLMIAFHYLVIPPPVLHELATKNAESDWQRDNGNLLSMDFTTFLNSLYELVDIWTDTAEEAEYISLLTRLLNGVAVCLTSPYGVGEKTALPRWRLKSLVEIQFDPAIAGESDTGAGNTGKSDETHQEAPASASAAPFTAVARLKRHKRKSRGKGGEAQVPLMTAERCMGIIAKIYQSKEGLDATLSQRYMGGASHKRRRFQRFDRFVLQYHIQLYGTKKLARKKLQYLCKAATHHGLTNPRLKLFCWLAGVAVRVSARPPVYQKLDFHAYACSDFLIPILGLLFQSADDVDGTLERWLGSGKESVKVSIPSLLTAMRSVCRLLPDNHPKMVDFSIKMNQLGENGTAAGVATGSTAKGDKGEQENASSIATGKASKKVKAVMRGAQQRSSQSPTTTSEKRWHEAMSVRTVDLDKALLAAMEVFLAEMEQRVMVVSLRSITLLQRWLRHSRLRRLQKEGVVVSAQEEELNNRSQEELLESAKLARTKLEGLMREATEEELGTNSTLMTQLEASQNAAEAGVLQGMIHQKGDERETHTAKGDDASMLMLDGFAGANAVTSDHDRAGLESEADAG